VTKPTKTDFVTNAVATDGRGAVTVLHPVTPQQFGDVNQHKRILEALLFAAAEPLDEESLIARLPKGADLNALLSDLTEDFSNRGVHLVKVAGKWAFRTAEDLRFIMQREAIEQKKLSKAALETLAIIAYHQPATRAEIEAVRGVSISKGTLDLLLELGWIRLRGRRRSPGRPVTYGTTDHFLNHFGLDTIGELPGLAELKGAGLLDGNLPPDFEMPVPNDDLLGPDEDPLDEEDDYMSEPLLELDDN